jgi:NAD+ kinase
VVRRGPHEVRLLHPRDHDHFALLRRKLHWGETAELLRKDIDAAAD